MICPVVVASEVSGPERVGILSVKPPDDHLVSKHAGRSGFNGLRTRLITTPEMSQTQWDRTITEMVEQQGMVPPSEEGRRIILEYLVETQSPQP